MIVAGKKKKKVMEFTDKFMMTWSVFEGSQMNRLCLLSADMEFWLQCWTEPSPLVKGRWLMRNEVLIILQRHRHTHTHTDRHTETDLKCIFSGVEKSETTLQIIF